MCEIVFNYFIFWFFYLNNWIDNILILEVSVRIKLDNKGEVIFKIIKLLFKYYYFNIDKYLVVFYFCCLLSMSK